MTEQDGFDARLAARFEREHSQVPGDAFVAATLKKMQASRQRREAARILVRVGALLAIVAASPWLIPGVEHLNAAVGSSLSWATDAHATWLLGAIALVVVVGARLRRR